MKRLSFLIFAGLFVFNSCDIDSNPLPKISDDRNKFEGTWICTDESVVFGTSTFTVNINIVGASDTVEIKNWYNLGVGTTTLGLVADNSITIPNQTVSGFAIFGSGFYSSNDEEIVISYSADDGSTQDQVVSTCTQ
ncbi:MAG: hypothetical protein KJO64_09300 [Bacteroidia bacterium]|nr:hypothetical protein [Bacteroidia bacterium]